ncbi:hypothetical protein B0H11DRAFT_2197791 [Mycena galericulata]|nr:hypothetical protein B0H11DRAFT_2197791 [Mycena galericulata]
MKEVPYFQRFQGGWPIRDFLKQYFRNANTKHKRDLEAERKAEKNKTGGWSSGPRSRSKSNSNSKSGSKSQSRQSEGEDESEGGHADEEGQENDDWVDFGNDEDEDRTTGDGDGPGEAFDEITPDQLFASDDDNPTPQLNQAEWDLEDGEEEEEVEPTDSPNRPKSSNKENEPVDIDMDEVVDVPAALKSKQLQNPPPSSLGSKRKISDSFTENATPNNSKRPRIVSPVKKSRAKQPASKSNPKRAQHPSNSVPVPTLLSRKDLPDICPASYCKHRIPENPSKELLSLFSKKRDLISQNGKSAPGCAELTRQICRMISSESYRHECFQIADAQGWPTEIDFSDVADRVLGLRDNIIDLARDSGSLEQSPVWLSFLSKIGYKVFAFGRAPSGSFSEAAELGKRCGYFGPKGRAILTSAIDDIISEALHPDQIYQTTASLINTPHEWDKEDPNSETISPSDFIDYILVPHAATVLIADDLEIDFEAALEVLSASSDFGDLSNLDPGDQNDQNSGSREIFIRTPSPVPPAKPSKKSERQTASTSPIRKLKITTLTSFPPPPVSKKNSAKEDSGETRTRDGKKGKKKLAPAPVHPYGTRKSQARGKGEPTS